MKVNQILCAAGFPDAVTNQMLAWREVFKQWGWKGADFGARIEPDMRHHGIRPLRQLEAQDELVLVHYSGYARDLERVFSGPARTVLLSHNVTPEEWFWPVDPADAVRCRLGREQLHEFARLADGLAGVSSYNAEELSEASGREARVIPVLFDRSSLASPGSSANGGAEPGRPPPTILFVGRLTPHKRQDLVIQAFAAYWRMQPEARLVLVGHALSPAYRQKLVSLAEELAPGAVSFRARLTSAELADQYRSADVFLCLSEHEGFCIPILEALHYGIPVVARDAAAVGEVVGDAGILVGAQDDAQTIAELLWIVVSDHELRQELCRRGERRLAAYDHQLTAQRMRSLLADLAP
ncbi:MAG TPA: glycosyltransferase family 4 protein [Solirubrobacteraceae bacterium]|nr:glycosyltransferase family 4 protein [Solirubrobacteraceae bacterium]